MNFIVLARGMFGEDGLELFSNNNTIQIMFDVSCVEKVRISLEQLEKSRAA